MCQALSQVLSNAWSLSSLFISTSLQKKKLMLKEVKQLVQHHKIGLSDGREWWQVRLAEAQNPSF